MAEDVDRTRVWEEVWEVRRVEGVLTPVSVILTTLSNMALLMYELRLVCRSRKLIPPKLLVMALASTDLIATLLGFLPLWVLFEVSQTPTHGTNNSKQPQLLHNESDTVSLSTQTSLGKVSFPGITTEVNAILSPWPATYNPLRQPAAHTVGYAVVLFLLTAFWTLAQCIVVVMGVERFLALRAPFFYTARCTIAAFLLVLAALFLVSCGVGSFHLIVHLAELKEQPPVFAGFLDARSMSHNVFTLVQGLVWTFVLLLCNWGVTCELRRMEESMTVMRMKDHSEYLKQLSMVHGAGREFARFMMAVNVVFLLSSCPNLVCVMLRLCGFAPGFSLQYFCWRMSHIAALVNPFLYGFLRKSLRSRIRRFLNQHVSCLRSQRVGALETGPVDQYRQDPALQTGSNLPNRTADDIVLRDPEASTVNLSD
ncbi:hypothetical protein ACOMHN_022531 [Nucella lapillus]